MRKKNPLTLGLALGVFLTFMVSCTPQQSSESELLPQPRQEQVDSSWTELSLREKIGQVMCLSYSPQQIKEIGTTREFFAKYPVGSFFMANWELGRYTKPDSLAKEYKKRIVELSEASHYPLLFSEDFETGLGNLLPEFTPLCPAMGLAATQSAEKAAQSANIMGVEARSIGINWILNPVVDLNLNPMNFITNIRALGSNPVLTKRLVMPQVNSLQRNGIAATIKHFPGDGTDYINQHFTTSQMKLSVDEWQKTYGQIFQHAIDSGVMCIMPGHISFPAYQKEKLNDEYLPATLSKELLTDLLKTKMSFNGVIVSDALNMAGIANYYATPLETEIASFLAGTDILLWPSLAFMDSLEARILRHEIGMDRLDDAVNRVWNMKKKLGLFNSEHQLLKAISNETFAEHREQALDIAKASLCLLSNKNDILPIDTLKSKRILVVVTAQTDQSKQLETLRTELEAKGFLVDMQSNLSAFAYRDKFESISANYSKIIFAFISYPGNVWGSLLLHDEPALTMWSANTLPQSQVISIGFGDPIKNLIYMPRVWARINCYGVDAISQRAVAGLLVGEFVASGKSPIQP